MRASRVVFVVSLLCYVCFILLYAPRLANPLWTDVEFSGWVSPIAHRMVQGERIYRDFTLPLPPGSFALMAQFQQLTGRFYLIDELWLCALCQLLMAIVAYALARLFTSERNAVLTMLATIPALLVAQKEIAYDHTAQLVSWTSLLVLAHALLRPAGKTRAVLLALSGFAASFTIAFKSSTGVGAVAATCLAVASASWMQRKSYARDNRRSFVRDAAFVAIGLAAGAVATIVVVLAVGGSLHEFYYVVFVDGPALKGGWITGFNNLYSYLVEQPPLHLSFLLGLVIAYLIVRIRNRHQLPGQDSADRSSERGSLRPRRSSWWRALPMSLFVVWVFGFGGLMLVGHAPQLPRYLQVGAWFGSNLLSVGLLALLVMIGLRHRASKLSSPRTDSNTVFVSIGIAAGMASLIHNVSDPGHRPLYDNNPVIPMAIMSVLMILDMARARVLKHIVACTMLLSLFGPSYERRLAANTLVTDPGFWKGLRVGPGGKVVLAAAQRVRALTGPNDTVLMLPEDPMFEALVGRDRPWLLGGIVFVDQYPERLLTHDAEFLQRHPPAVVVLQPEDDSWNTFYGIWNSDSPACRLQRSFLRNRVSWAYQFDSRYPTVFHGTNTSMSLLVRKDPAVATPR